MEPELYREIQREIHGWEYETRLTAKRESLQHPTGLLGRMLADHRVVGHVLLHPALNLRANREAKAMYVKVRIDKSLAEAHGDER